MKTSKEFDSILTVAALFSTARIVVASIRYVRCSVEPIPGGRSFWIDAQAGRRKHGAAKGWDAERWWPLRPSSAHCTCRHAITGQKEFLGQGQSERAGGSEETGLVRHVTLSGTDTGASRPGRFWYLSHCGPGNHVPAFSRPLSMKLINGVAMPCRGQAQRARSFSYRAASDGHGRKSRSGKRATCRQVRTFRAQSGAPAVIRPDQRDTWQAAADWCAAFPEAATGG